MTSKFQAALATAILVITSATIMRAEHARNSDSQIRLKTNLTGATIQGNDPGGNAEFRSERGRTSFKTQVEHVKLAAGTILDVAVQHAGISQVVGHLTLNTFGFGELDLESQDGDTVPAVVAGDLVIVSNAGVAILSGVF
jgi:hypothetical protein